MYARGDEVGNSVGENAGLPGAGAGDDQQRSLAVFDGVSLIRIQLRQVECDAMVAGHFARAVARDRTRIGNDRGPRT